MKKFSVLIAGRHSTSITLEDAFYAELRQAAREQNKSINMLVSEIDECRKEENLSSAIRLYILNYLKQKNSRIQPSLPQD